MNRQERIKRLKLKGILHTIRLRDGVPADYYKLTVASPNFATGNKGVGKLKINIPQFITFQVDLARKFEYDIGWLKANSNFTYGGIFEVGDRFGIIDAIYLGNNVVEQKDIMVYDGKRYELETVQKLDGNVGYFVKLKHIAGGSNEQIHERLLYQQIVVTDEPAIQ